LRPGKQNTPGPFSATPLWGGERTGIAIENNHITAEQIKEYRCFFIECIIRQIRRMPLEDLREAYTAVSDISDRRKGIKKK